MEQKFWQNNLRTRGAVWVGQRCLEIIVASFHHCTKHWQTNYKHNICSPTLVIPTLHRKNSRTSQKNRNFGPTFMTSPKTKTSSYDPAPVLLTGQNKLLKSCFDLHLKTRFAQNLRFSRVDFTFHFYCWPQIYFAK